MKTKLSKYLNIYVVTGLIGGFAFLYLLSFAVVLGDVSNGSSLKMKKAYIEKKQEMCRQDPSQC